MSKHWNKENLVIIAGIFVKPFIQSNVYSLERKVVFVMSGKWNGSFGLLFAFALFLFLFPGKGLAVDFSIPDVKIDAFLQENGLVEVTETFTYSFDGEFNGITRELIPKKGASITNLKASENGKSLRVEKDSQLYKIYRKGSDETIKIKLTYFIKNGVDVYTDMAEFYWPFFDERNEATYENLKITVHPPKATKNVIAFGYDEAFQTEKVGADGTVVFDLGEVPFGENGDIRVAFGAALFPNAINQAGVPIREKLEKAKQDLLDEAAEEAANTEKFSMIAKVGLSGFSIILLFIIIRNWMTVRLNKMAIERESSDSFSIPKQTMSLPATIYYMNSGLLQAERLAAALMDLVRKGYVRKSENDQFVLSIQSSQSLANHERILIEFLFDEIGSNDTFSFADLKAYTKFSKNNAKYQSYLSKWTEAVKKEIKEHELYANRSKLRWFLGLSSLILLSLGIMFLVYGLFGAFLLATVLLFTAIIYGFAYRPKTWNGLVLTHEWNTVKKHLGELEIDNWKALTEDERMRGFIFGLGIKDLQILRKSKKLLKAFKVPDQQSSYQNGIYPNDFYTIMYYGPITSTHFHIAHDHITPSSDSSSNSSSGGGVGGGGGGSGAF
jgi:uncharacterized membrane protein YgcG